VVGDDIDLIAQGGAVTVHEHVAGFVDDPMGTYAYITLDRLASDTGAMTLAANGVLVRYVAGADAAIMRDRLSARGDAAFIDTKALARIADQYMGLFYAFVGVMLVLGAVISFALIFTTMSVNISERATEIATLQANGMSPGEVSRLLAAENLLLSAVGLIPGFIVGYVTSWAFMRSFSSDLFRFDLTVRPTTFVLIALAVLGVAFLSQWPALRQVASIDIGREIRVLSS
jgi:putative ABC transport system permease protein